MDEPRRSGLREARRDRGWTQEEAADQLVRTAVAGLFQDEKDPIRLIKLKEIYEFLEQTTDYCEDVADALQNVVVKNS